ncbi:hypothetical protein MRX96_017864 [Rhipicephalus microplus]
MVLLALVNQRYSFRHIRVGSPGRCHDAGFYAAWGLKKVVESAHSKSPHATIEAQSVATPLAEAAADVVQTSFVGTGAAPASASPSSSALEGAEMMDTAGPAPDPTATAPPVPPVAPPGVAAQTKGSRKGAKSGGPGSTGTPRTSDDDMDVWPFLPATQRKERPVTAKPLEGPKKPKPRVTAPKDDT